MYNIRVKLYKCLQSTKYTILSFPTFLTQMKFSFKIFIKKEKLVIKIREITYPHVQKIWGLIESALQISIHFYTAFVHNISEKHRYSSILG